MAAARHERNTTKNALILTFYVYVGNYPLNYVDPVGLWQLTISGGRGIGGSVTLGYNWGQWSVGAWLGVGEGLSVRLNPLNTGPQEPGFQPSIKTQYASNLGLLGGLSIGSQLVLIFKPAISRAE